MRNPVRHFYEFGPFRLDPEKHRLLRDGEPVPLSPKAAEALLVLVQNAGKLLEREALMQAVWAESFVEDANLTVAISNLRKVLGQNNEAAEYIETIPRIGYRFVADVRAVMEELAPLVIEKHTLSQTVIEEEFSTDEPSFAEKVAAVSRTSGRRAVSSVVSQRSTAVLLASIAVVTVALGTFVYLKRSNRDNTSLVSNSSVEAIRSIAVLPPRLISGQGENASLSLGMADALITRLGGIRKLVVRPTSAVIGYLDKNQDPLEVGEALGVDAILDGSLQRDNGRVRITWRLLNTASGAQLWAGNFDEADADVFKLQDSVSNQVAQALFNDISHNERALLSKHQTNNPEAYAQYLKGNYFWNKRGLESQKAAQYYRKAIELDPKFARAYVGLATVDASEQLPSPEAKAMIEYALQLDNNLSEAHATYGFIQMFHHWDWVAAERELDRALELDPNSVAAHHWKGVYLSIHSRLDEAKIEMHRALELDPLSLPVLADIGQLHYFAREYDQAIDYCNRALAIDPDFQMAHYYLTDIYRAKGMEKEAMAEWAEYNSFHWKAMGIEPAARQKMREYYLTTGSKRIAREELQGVMSMKETERKTSAQRIAQLYCILGDKQQAVRWLKASIEKPIFWLPYVNVDPFYESLRTEPGFHDLLLRLGLESSNVDQAAR
jgi:DNA-binding winged helix-turn-helix (wHTH) protein/TolB-like protein/Tfp pilus assembly protein PilF